MQTDVEGGGGGRRTSRLCSSVKKKKKTDFVRNGLSPLKTTVIPKIDVLDVTSAVRTKYSSPEYTLLRERRQKR